jgi:hypothetical protein
MTPEELAADKAIAEIEANRDKPIPDGYKNLMRVMFCAGWCDGHDAASLECATQMLAKLKSACDEIQSGIDEFHESKRERAAEGAK